MTAVYEMVEISGNGLWISGLMMIESAQVVKRTWVLGGKMFAGMEQFLIRLTLHSLAFVIVNAPFRVKISDRFGVVSFVCLI